MASFIAPVQTELGKHAGLTQVPDEPNTLGWKLAGTSVGNVPTGAGTIGWIASTQVISRLATSTGNTYAAMTAGATSQWLRTYNYGFDDDISTGTTTIDGVEVEIGVFATVGNINISNVHVSWGASAATLSTTSKSETNPTTGLYTYGGAADLWGEGSIAVSDVRSSDFGVSIDLTSTTGVGQFRISHVGMKVYFTDTADGTVRVVQHYVEVLSTETVVVAGAPDNRVIVVT